MKFVYLTWALLLSVDLALGQAVFSAKERRLALVVANARYRFIPPNHSAKKEGELMRKALETLGFEVMTAEDITRDQFVSLEGEFIKKLQAGDVCWVYYAGYTIQVDGINYFVSTDFQPVVNSGNASLPGHAFSRLQQRIEQTGASLKIFTIENASEAPELQAASSARRLAAPDLQDLTQTLIAYATQPNQGDAFNAANPGLFTAALTSLITEQGLPLFEIFQRVQGKVQAGSAGRQMSYFVQNITKTWFLREPIKHEPVKQDVVRTGLYYPHPLDRQDYVWIPAGTFWMGCVPTNADGGKCRVEETPRHKVTLTKSFWIGRNEVETSAYKRFVYANKLKKMPKSAPFWNKHWNEDKDSLPMAFVNWEDSRDYCSWVGGRLPTEAEWEYAARAGSQNQVFPYEGSDSREKANFLGKKGNDRFEDPAPVRKFDANAFGLYDMAGNVWEWALDWYSPTYYTENLMTDPLGPSGGQEHSIRGGSFGSDAHEHLRISFRKGFPHGTEAIGFRCVLDDTSITRTILGVK